MHRRDAGYLHHHAAKLPKRHRSSRPRGGTHWGCRPVFAGEKEMVHPQGDAGGGGPGAGAGRIRRGKGGIGSAAYCGPYKRPPKDKAGGAPKDVPPACCVAKLGLIGHQDAGFLSVIGGEALGLHHRHRNAGEGLFNLLPQVGKAMADVFLRRQSAGEIPHIELAQAMAIPGRIDDIRLKIALHLNEP